MAQVSLKQLRYFDALARLGHFGRAAEACSVSQPALSVQIRELETAWGQTLFERSPRQVRLTLFGERVLPRVQSILRQTDDLEDLARTNGDRLSGRLRLGVIPTIAPYLLPRLIPRLSAHFPDIDLAVRETVTPRLIEELHAGQLDTAILALPIDDPALTEMPLFDEALLLVRPKAHESWPVPSPETLRDMRVLLLEEGHCFRDHALSLCNLSDRPGTDGLDGSSLSTLVQMVGAGLGVTLIPEMAVAVEARAAPVCIGRFQGDAPERTVGIVWRKTSTLTNPLTEIAELVRETAQSLRST